jgi:hypothetical protein
MVGKYDYLLMSSQYTTVSLLVVKVRPTPQTPEVVFATDLTSPRITGSSGGRPTSTYIAPVGVVRIAPVIPKNANLCTLLSFFLSLVIWQPGHHTKDAKEMVSRMMVTEPVDHLGSQTPPCPTRPPTGSQQLMSLPHLDLHMLSPGQPKIQNNSQILDGPPRDLI